MKRVLLEMMGLTESDGGSWKKMGNPKKGYSFDFKTDGKNFEPLKRPSRRDFDYLLKSITRQTKLKDIKITPSGNEGRLVANVSADEAEMIVDIIVDEEWGFSEGDWDPSGKLTLDIDVKRGGDDSYG